MENIEDYYRDCAWENTRFIDRKISSGWTSYGIKCIDGEYSRRIRNIRKPVLRLIKVDRNPHYEDGTYRSDYWDDYTELPLDEDFKSYDRSVFVHNEGEIYRELEDKRNDTMKRNNKPYQERYIIVSEYCYTHPIYSAKHKGEDPEALRKEIDDNPHLHYKIKENLLDNLKSVLKYRNDEEFN